MCVIKLFDTFVTSIIDVSEVRDILYALDKTSEYMDDHKSTSTPVKPEYVLIVTDGQTTKICPVPHKTNGVWAFSLNPLYLNQGVIHCSTKAIGTFHIQKDCGIGEAVELFNAKMKTKLFCQVHVSYVVICDVNHG